MVTYKFPILMGFQPLHPLKTLGCRFWFFAKSAIMDRITKKHKNNRNMQVFLKYFF